MRISASHVNYYHLCLRKLWLYNKQISLEKQDINVQIGTVLGQTTYNRRAKKWKELDLDLAKIDHYDPANRIIREVKKSPKLEYAHIAQVQYYLWLLEKRGITDVRGIIEYPQQRQRREVYLTSSVRKDIEAWLSEIERISKQPDCPTLVKKSYCKRCAFYEFCYI